ncbi:hypothetical protein [Piscinibacter sp.]|uniref:hypothetical protein n=1 Tax=Piscinibacter sp. TaxID=1903157 RepID=UPI00355A14EB
MSLLEVFLAAIGGSSVALAIAAYLGRSFIDLQVSRVIEKYKAELQQKSEVLKTDLSIYAHEQNVGLSRLDEQRSQAVKEIYAVANKWQELLLEIARPDPPTKLPPDLRLKRYLNLAQDFVKVAEELSVKTRDNAIFFQQQSYEIIARFGAAATDLSCAFYDQTFGKVDLSRNPSYDQVSPMIEKERAALRDSPKEDFGQLQNLLLAEFRRLMKADRAGQPAPHSSGTPHC